jgi:hypothetical protein
MRFTPVATNPLRSKLTTDNGQTTTAIPSHIIKSVYVCVGLPALLNISKIWSAANLTGVANSNHLDHLKLFRYHTSL